MFDFSKKLARIAGAISLGLTSLAAAAPADAQEVMPEGAMPGPALWQVGDDDTTIYLFGTVHVLPDGIDWYDQRIERAFTSSSELVTEVDVSDPAEMAQQLMGNATLTDGQTLRGMMTEENRNEYEEALVTLGMPVETLDTMEPWFAALNLSVLPLLQAGYNPDAGVEMALQTRAGDKSRGALETVEQQIALFDGMTPEAQLTYLDYTVEALPDVVTQIDTMVREWLEGDADQLAEFMNSEIEDPALYNRLLVDRNANWVDWIEQRLQQPGTVFVAVGAGHLAGDGSVQHQLADRGIEVTRVWQ